MKYFLCYCFLLMQFSIAAQCEEIERIEKKIESVQTLTLEQMIELDNQIMELQFAKMNELFEALRTKLSSIEIVETNQVPTAEANNEVPIAGIHRCYFEDSIEEIINNKKVTNHNIALQILNLKKSGREKEKVTRIVEELKKLGHR